MAYATPIQVKLSDLDRKLRQHLFTHGFTTSIQLVGRGKEYELLITDQYGVIGTILGRDIYLSREGLISKMEAAIKAFVYNPEDGIPVLGVTYTIYFIDE